MSQRTSFEIAAVIMLALFVIDVADSDAIRLHTLYVFPLTLIVIHSAQIRPILFGYALSVIFQFFTFVSYDILTISKITEVLVAIAASGLTMTLAKVARDQYLATKELASRDPLTDLLNRRSFDELLEAELARQQRYGGSFSMAVIDLDNFKKLNDSQGHRAGDDALKRVADALRTHTRETDSIARLGGDEFALLMPVTNQPDCANACENLCKQIAVVMREAHYSVTASIGHATFIDAPETASHVLLAADAAMYDAKAKGKGCTAGYARLHGDA